MDRQEQLSLKLDSKAGLWHPLENMEFDMRFTLTVLSALLLTSCATDYKPTGITGGFSELQLNESTYEISVRGNGFTSLERAKEIAMLRAADLMIQHGFERFVVLDAGGEMTIAGVTPVTASRVGNTVVASGGDPITKPHNHLTIRGLKTSDPEFPNALDARLIYGQLKAKFPE